MASDKSESEIRARASVGEPSMTVPSNILDDMDDGRCWVCGNQCTAVVSPCICCQVCIEVQEEIGVE